MESPTLFPYSRIVLTGDTCEDRKAKTAKIIEFAEMAEEVMSMNKHAVIRNLPDGTCSRQQILRAARIVEHSFKETQLRYLMGILQNSSLIVRVGRNQYKKVEKEPKRVSSPGFIPVQPCR